ncbi:protein PIN-LIKES 7-like [Salvia miltiorrhiza]|uniref:protein PIN-LIKES 7-like n=1 Tax=Salvia miltiorrhiza TaxID=226208 RepID=UPI0025ABC271|nr:protein PIN-LIKES 7-like [Salvia miltiorrhiza]XP_057784117.1 protein PIN-LIKES 7-like [Salvia miltiorrhiza]XP_057784118.1 protein PIN-LIKES 7-like [Salvia miltiorrhiza]XP_057784119.1 protein PIN-LIKES 7-like [Salvia miltiorrhiza]
MGFLTLFEVASMPILQVLIISMLGAFMATDYLKLLPPDARKYMNKIVYVAFTPSLVFISLAKSVNFQEIISWWFMPVNIGLTFLFGASFGWIVVKILRPEPHIRNLILAICSAGNLGNILLIIIPAICKENGSPFGDANVCSTIGLSYVSYSMAVGAFYIWTYTFHLIRSAGVIYRASLEAEDPKKQANQDLEANEKSLLLNGAEHAPSQLQTIEVKRSARQVMGILHQVGDELMSPPVVAAILGFIFGAVTWLRDVIIGESAPLGVISDSISLLGDGTIPCITLILGGNLMLGLRKAKLSPLLIVAVIVVKYVLLPIIGIGVVLTAAHLGLVPRDPLFRFVLMIQFSLPPAMNIGTMTQLFDVAQEECSVLFLWTYLAAAIALTGWSTVFMWILT